MKEINTKSVLCRWEAVLKARPGEPAVLAPSGEKLRTFSDLERESEEIGSRLLDFPSRSVVGICIENRPEWPALYLAALKRNLVVLPLDASLSRSSLGDILKIAGAGGYVTMEGSDLVSRKLAYPAPEWGAPEPDFLKITSGTASTPRLVLFRHQQILADCDQICETMEIHPADVNYGVISFAHSYGFSNLITPLIFRGVPLVAAEDGIPRAILRGLEYSGATVFPGVPPLFNALLKLEAPLPATLRLLISAGAPLGLEITQAFRKRYGRKIHSFYGSSECGGICYDGLENIFPESGFVGTPLKGVALEKIAAGEGSEIQCRVRSGAVGMRYFPKDEPALLGEGMFLPSDLLSATDKGYRIIGRLSDFINVGGKKVSPSEVEKVIKSQHGVRECVAFGVKDLQKTEVVHVCVVAEKSLTERDLRSACAEFLSPWQMPHVFHFVQEIPHTPRGKISRKDLSRRFGANTA